MLKGQKSKYFPDSFYRVAIKGLCVKDGKILLMRESEGLGGGWELPGGGLDFGEDIRECFMREIKEETGLTVTKMSEKPFYVWPTRVDNWREMDWYYTMVLAYRIEFKDLDFKATDECLEVRFFSKDELAGLDHKMNKQTETFAKVFDSKEFDKPI